MKKLTLFLCLCSAVGTSQTKNGSQFFINELDADQDGTDTLEFIEIKSTPSNTSLDGMIVVLFNGNHAVNGSYNVINLDGFTTDGNGLFIVGNDAVPGVDIAIGASNKIQNGPDAVGLYFGVPADFPNGTAPSTANLLDALVYAKGEPDDVDLLLALDETIQYNEDLNSNSGLESLQRKEDGTYCTAPITLNNENECEVCTLIISATNSSCDANTSGIDTTTVLIDFEGGGTETFTITLDTGTGIISGDDPTTTTAGTIIISEVEENTKVTVQLISAQCDIHVTTTTPLCETSGDFATIAQLRSGIIGETYTLTGEAVLTFQQNLRNQKFVEDSTAAILIDDPQEIITTPYNIGDGITGITGSLNTFNGMLQFTPEIDPDGPTSQGNSLILQAVSIDQLNAAPEDFEAEFVQIVQGVDIDTSVNTTWIADQVYAMSNPNGIFNFRAIFFDVNYLGLEVPTQNVNIAGIVTERNGNFYLTSRSLNDVHGVILGAPSSTKEDFLIFPNPATEDFIQISSSSPTKMKVEIYDLTGKLLYTRLTNDSINITPLASGFYLLKIKQNGFETIRKLVIR